MRGTESAGALPFTERADGPQQEVCRPAENQMSKLQTNSCGTADSATDGRVRVLIVDDTPANLLVLNAILGGMELDLVECLSGAEAIERAGSDEFAVILLDMMMPEMSGFETAVHLRSQECSRHTPIIFLTANDIDGDVLEEGYSLGAVDFLVKPLVPVILQSKVRGFVELFHEKQRARREADQLRLLIEGTSDHAIFMLDPEGFIVTWNSGAERLKGYKASEIIGQHFSQFYPAAANENRWPAHELHVARADGRFEDEGWRVRKDGSTFWANVVITALRDEQGVLRGFSKVTRDLTHRRQADETLRRSEERFHLLFEAVKDYAIFLLDPDGTIATWNAGAERIKQYRADEIIGRHFSIFYPREAIDRGWPDHELKVARAEGRFEDEGWRIRKDGSQFWANVVISALKDESGKLLGFAKVTRDMTERKKAEDDGRRLVEEITARRMAEENDRRKDEFLAMLAHELRNPLAPILSGLSVLQMGTLTLEDAEVVKIMGRQVSQLVRLVDDLLDASRLATGKVMLRRECVAVRSFIETAVEASRPLMQKADHRLTLSFPNEPLFVDVDPARMAQVVTNLLNNAAKYTPSKGRIALFVEQEDGDVVLRITDNGIGIPADLLPRVFDTFMQVGTSLARSQGGLGLGLTLVRRLVEMHGGTVTAQSAGQGQGSEFVVRLHTVNRPEIVPVSTIEPSRSIPLRVLAVDDNVGAATILGRLIRKLGDHTVELAHNGPMALSRLQEFHPDVILLDIGLPGMDGYQLVRELRSELVGKETFIVALTGYGQEEDRRRAREAGFDEHVTKPIDIETLRRILDRPRELGEP